MKQFMALMIALVCVLGLLGCGGQSDKSFDKADKLKEYQFRGTVLERAEDYLLVEPVDGSAECNCADKIEVSLTDKTSWPIPQVGDLVNVVYDGIIQEIYPARIPRPYRVEIIITDENDTIQFHEKVFNKSDLSQETIEWLAWYNELTEMDQLSISYIPSDLYELCGYSNAEDIPAETE